MELPVLNQNSLREGTIFEGRFEILSVLGVGGVGVVYKARHVHMNKTVAIKVLLPSLVSDDSDLNRFKQEASTASNLTHPSIVSIFDFGIASDGNAYLVMEYLDGCDLDDLIAGEGRLHPELFLRIFCQVCDALHHAHRRGVIHRDMKPSNIMVIDTEEASNLVKIVDFGLAKLTAQDMEQHLTLPGMTLGTPIYMSPEQCRGGPLDHRSDIYSLGCVMYAALTGSVPFISDSAAGTISKHLLETPPPFSVTAPELNLPEALEQVILTTLQKDPDARQQSMAELRNQLANAIPHVAGTSVVNYPVDFSPQAMASDSLLTTKNIPIETTYYRLPTEKYRVAPHPNEKSMPSSPTLMLGAALIIGGGAVLLGLSSWHKFMSARPTQLSAMNGTTPVAVHQSDRQHPSKPAPGNADKQQQVTPAISIALPTAKHPTKTEHPRLKDINGLSAKEEAARAASFEEQAKREFGQQDYRAAQASYEACLQCQRSLYQHDDPHLFFTLGQILRCMQYDRFDIQFASYLDQALAIFNSKRPVIMHDLGRSKEGPIIWRTFARACDRTARFCSGATKDSYLSWSADFYYLDLQACPDEQKTAVATAYSRVLEERGNAADAKAVRQKYNLPELQYTQLMPAQRYEELIRRRLSQGRNIWQRLPAR